MNYVIDPSWFYWIKVCDTLRKIVMIIAIVGTASCVILLPVYYCDAVCDEEDKKRFKRMAAKCIGAVVIAWLIVVFVPSKQTLIEMQIARMASVDNIEWGVEQIKKIVDYIMEAAKGL